MSAADLVDVVVVGSGCTGATAAATLCDCGARVLMLDVGMRDDRYRDLIPPKDLLSIRRTEPEQHRYFLGDDLEGLPRGRVGSGAQLTPPRQHMLAEVAALLPRTASGFSAVESLAYGGLGVGWGLGCNMFSLPELDAVGLDPQRMHDAYRAVARRIGVSGTRDDASPYTCADLGDLLQPPSDTDRNGRALLARYERRRPALARRGFAVGRPALALLTRDLEKRRATAYRDMDFYEDRDRSAYRPWITVDGLRERSGFEYRSGQLMLSFCERNDVVNIETLDVSAGERRVFRARRLVLATGVLGTARIVLRSAGARGLSLPLLCNPYVYIPCVQPSLLWRPTEERRTSVVQAVLFHDPRRVNVDVAQASIYSYGSLLFFRLVNEVPLAMADAGPLMRALVPALTIAGVHFPETTADGGRMSLVADASSPTGDALAVDYPQTDARRGAIRAREREFVRALRLLGCWALRHVRPPMGASIHYAGCLPFSDDERPFTLSRHGRLHGRRRVYVADGSGFRYLPAKGLTFSLMANAHAVAEAALRDD